MLYFIYYAKHEEYKEAVIAKLIRNLFINGNMEGDFELRHYFRDEAEQVWVHQVEVSWSPSDRNEPYEAHEMSILAGKHRRYMEAAMARAGRFIILKQEAGPFLEPQPMFIDSRQATDHHISLVRANLEIVRERLRMRGLHHDVSKMKPPEKAMFDQHTVRLKKMVFGSDAYNQGLKELGEALEHHYAHNSHHPEHYKDGIDGMSLLDVIEMLCDWEAATHRHENGDIHKSLEYNRNRFKISDQLFSILRNTVEEMQW